MKKWTICMCLGLLMTLVAMNPQAEEVEPTEREKELLNRVEELEKRLWQLETELRETKAAPPRVPAELTSRVEDVEKKVEVGLAKVGAVEEQVKKIEPVEVKPDTFRAFWKEGLNFETADKAFKLKIGGRIHFDSAFTSGDDELVEEVGALKDGVEFRRARIALSGSVYDKVEFKTQYDFAGGSFKYKDDKDKVSTFGGGQAKWKDVYLGVLHLPVVGNIRIGQFYEPFGLEEQTSSNYITFMERSLTSALGPSRNAGLMFHNSELGDRMTWSLGVFKDTNDVGDRISDGEYNFTARVTGTPWYEDKGRKLLHLGAAYSHRNPNDDKVRFRERPEVHISPRYVDTHDITGLDDMDLVGAEAALVAGPFSLQGEYINAMTNTADGTDPTFSGFYAMASYFLTGENRAYKGGLFSRVKPKKNFGAGGPGAWEIAARYSHLDLDDGELEGGKLDDVTVGLNWYLNPNTRFMLNYVHADLDEVGQSDTFQMRAQVDF
jgi:phosphate-selective porin OprO/OprP